jgi:hypothetical protein
MVKNGFFLLTRKGNKDILWPAKLMLLEQEFEERGDYVDA